MSATIIPIANQKGGVGKTTTALTLGAALVRKGRKVLIMDLDPHANASVHLAFYPENLKHTAYDLFMQKKPDPEIWDRIIYPAKEAGFDFVPSHIRLSELEFSLRDKPGKGRLLQKFLSPVTHGYDYILLDCPPHVGILLVNSLLAGTRILIPIQTDFLALHGLRLIFDTIRMINKVLDKPKDVRALATMYDKRAGACRRVLKILRDKLGPRLFQTTIGLDTKFREASAMGKIIYDVDANTQGARQYMQLAEEIEAL